jgi:hypothetical protein
MPIQTSPGINVSEYDQTTVVPAVSTTAGAIAGIFNWGPVGKLAIVSNETELADRFGKPNQKNFETFFTAANFLAYGNQLYVSRAANTTAYDDTSIGTFTAVAKTGANLVANATNVIFNINNDDDYQTKYDAGNFASADPAVKWAAKYPGATGNSLKVSVCDGATAWGSKLTNVANTLFKVNSKLANIQFSGLDYTNANTAWQALTVGDFITVGNSKVGYQKLKIAGKGGLPSGNQFQVAFTDKYKLIGAVNMAGTITRAWEFQGSAPKPTATPYNLQYGNTSAVDSLHVVVTDRDGKITGSAGAILEVFSGLSRATDAVTPEGNANYYVDVINQNSKWVWFTNHRIVDGTYANTANNIATVTTITPQTLSMASGNDGLDEVSIGDHAASVADAYNLLGNKEYVDVSLILGGKAGGADGVALSNYIIDNIAEQRKDCVVFISPPKEAVVNNKGNEVVDLSAFVLGDPDDEDVGYLQSSSYAVVDSGYKYQYDKYNDVYRWVPLNGDIAGLCVNTDNVRDPWWSPAGFNRGQVKNVVKLAFNPTQTDRDVLYPLGLNPVVNFPGQGTILYGDKTFANASSAFDRINVRRLFITLEKAIAKAAKALLFEFNDSFTRSQFVSLVNPYLRDVQARRGITDFRVVCDDSNNTAEVIDSNRFVGDIYIKPARSINYIQLNFVAVRSGVEFSEIVGKFQ